MAPPRAPELAADGGRWAELALPPLALAALAALLVGLASFGVGPSAPPPLGGGSPDTHTAAEDGSREDGPREDGPEPGSPPPLSREHSPNTMLGGARLLERVWSRGRLTLQAPLAPNPTLNPTPAPNKPLSLALTLALTLILALTLPPSLTDLQEKLRAPTPRRSPLAADADADADTDADAAHPYAYPNADADDDDDDHDSDGDAAGGGGGAGGAPTLTCRSPLAPHELVIEDEQLGVSTVFEALLSAVRPHSCYGAKVYPYPYHHPNTPMPLPVPLPHYPNTPTPQPQPQR